MKFLAVLRHFFRTQIPKHCPCNVKHQISISAYSTHRTLQEFFHPSMMEKQCGVRFMSLNKFLDYSKVPTVAEADLEVQFVRGSGPGGQATNKTNNAVILKHKPTGIVVKCHQTRSMWDNKKKAMEILITKLDNLINGDESIEAQTRAHQAKQSAKRERKKRKLDEMKAAFNEREGLGKEKLD